LDPLGVSIISPSDGDLSGDTPVVVLVSDGAERELLEDTVGLTFEVLDAVL